MWYTKDNDTLQDVGEVDHKCPNKIDLDTKFLDEIPQA